MADKPKKDEYEDYINEAAKAHNIDPHLIRSMIHRESSGRAGVLGPKIKGHKRAMGLMQLKPGTAKEMGAVNPMDPRENIMAGTKYMRKLMDRYEGDTSQALAAYNAGPARVKKGKGIPDLPQTKEYVSKILNDYASRRPYIKTPNVPIKDFGPRWVGKKMGTKTLGQRIKEGIF